MFQPNSNPIQMSGKNRTQKRLESPHLLDYQADRRKVKDKYGNKSLSDCREFWKKKIRESFLILVGFVLRHPVFSEKAGVYPSKAGVNWWNAGVFSEKDRLRFNVKYSVNKTCCRTYLLESIVPLQRLSKCV